MRITSSVEILNVLANAPGPMAVHEIGKQIPHYSENNLATRLSELARPNGDRPPLVKGWRRPGFRYNEWELYHE